MLVMFTEPRCCEWFPAVKITIRKWDELQYLVAVILHKLKHKASVHQRHQVIQEESQADVNLLCLLQLLKTNQHTHLFSLSLTNNIPPKNLTSCYSHALHVYWVIKQFSSQILICSDLITFCCFTKMFPISAVTTLTIVVMSSLKRSENRFLRGTAFLSSWDTCWLMLFTWSEYIWTMRTRKKNSNNIYRTSCIWNFKDSQSWLAQQRVHI